MSEVKKPYDQVRERLLECRTDADLFRAWREIQPLLREIKPPYVSWLVAMKDQRKQLIASGRVDDYDAARLKASTTDWNDPQVMESFRRDAAALRVTKDVFKIRTGRSTTRH